MDYHVWGAMLEAYCKLKTKLKTSAKLKEARLWVGVLTQVQILGAPPPLKIWEGKKRSKIGAIYDKFRV